MKRKTWKDRRCRHGRPPIFRAQYDIIHCDVPGCWETGLRGCGFVSVLDRSGLEAALKAFKMKSER